MYFNACSILTQMFTLTNRQKSFYVVTVSGCACPGSTLMYECTVMGSHGGTTIWTGSALNCPSSSNEISLFHTRFTSYGTYDSCNNGSIVAGSLSVEDNLYISQLNVTITSNILGKTIGCGYDGGYYIYFQPTILPITGLNLYNYVGIS